MARTRVSSFRIIGIRISAPSRSIQPPSARPTWTSGFVPGASISVLTTDARKTAMFPPIHRTISKNGARLFVISREKGARLVLAPRVHAREEVFIGRDPNRLAARHAPEKIGMFLNHGFELFEAETPVAVRVRGVHQRAHQLRW